MLMISELFTIGAHVEKVWIVKVSYFSKKDPPSHGYSKNHHKIPT